MKPTHIVSPARKSELVLIVCFLAVIFAVPLTQTALEWRRGERVQFTDVFRYNPTAKNLRQFEQTLQEKSVIQQRLRPKVQWALFQCLQDTGAKAMRGRGGGLFYRPDVRYLVEPNRLEADRSDARWVRASDGRTQRESVVRAIITFRDQLKERGIELLVMPAPGKPSVYPDQLTARAAGKEQDFRSPTLQLLRELQARGAQTVDLYTAFQAARRGEPNDKTAGGLYLARDTHWTPAGAKIAAQTVAAKLRELGWSPPATREFKSQTVRLNRWGDVLDMMQIPGLRSDFAAEPVVCEQVSDPDLGLLVPTPSDRPGAYKHPAQQSPILVLGDSFCRIYQLAEPQSLGERADAVAGLPARAQPDPGPKRLLPGSAGFISLLALELKSPVDAIVSDGGASTDVRRRLSTHAEILEGKKVVIWEFVERDIALGREGWEDAPLPVKLD